MRVRAYGGTRYGERVRIGEWPEFDAAFVEDEYGLAAGRSFGVGVLQPAPFLIVRERQTVGDRSYAYTLLLDPGRDVWERFGWNGALMLMAILEASPELGNDLVARPEAVGEGGFAKRLSSLTPPALAAPKSPSALEIALAAAPMAASELVLSARDLSLDRRPTLEETASALERLPVCFRSGLGWLIGGRRGSGWTFGCSLVVDDVDRSTQLTSEQSDALVRAQAVLEACRALSADPSMNSRVGPFLDKPLAEWSAAPAAVLSQITVLARCAGASSADPPLVDAAADAVALEGPFVAEIRAAVLRLATYAAGPLSGPLTRFLVETEILSPGSVEPALAQRLDPEAVAGDLLRRRLDLLSPGARFAALSPEQALGVWQALIQGAADADSVPEVLKRSLTSLASRVSGRAALRNAGLLLAAAAVERSAALGAPFWRWVSFRDDSDMWPLLEEKLERESRRALAPAARDTHLSYVALAGDPRGDWLAATHPGSVPDVVETLLQEMRDAGALRSEAALWLQEAARSPVRPLLSVEKKKRIADAIDDRCWTRFRALWNLCHGEPPPRLRGGTVAATEREQLMDELPGVLAAAAQAPNGVRLGDLDFAALSKIVGGKLNRKLLEQAAKGKPRERTRLARGLREQGEPDLYRKVIAEAWLDPASGESLSPSDLDDAAFAEVVAKLLLGRGPEADAEYRERTALLLSGGDAGGRLGAAVRAALSAAGDGAGARLFRRFAGEPEVVEQLLVRVDAALRRRLVETGAAAAPEDFDALASALLARTLGRRPSLVPFPSAGRAVFEYLVGDAGREALRRVARRVLGSEAAGAQRRLEALLADSPQSVAPAISSEAAEGRRQGLLENTKTSLKNFASRWKGK